MLNTQQNESDCQQTQPQIINNGVYCEVSLWSREKTLKLMAFSLFERSVAYYK